MRYRYRERKLRDLEELRKAIEGLEQDEGIRMAAKGGGFIFITRDEEHYTLSITEGFYEPRSRRHLPGGKETWLYPKKSGEVWEIALKKMESPVRAWLY